MNADLEHLIVLQAQDLELARLRSELNDAPKWVTAAETASREATARLEGMRAALAREEALQRRQAAEVKDRKDKIVRLRQQMETAANGAQIAALQHEIEFAEAAIRTADDEEFASMERGEELRGQATVAEAEQGRCVAALALAGERAREVMVHNRAALAGIGGERTTLRGEIEEGSLVHYDRVARSRGTGVAEALDGQCTACRMRVRPQRWSDLISREHEDEIFTCESCGRLLFYDPRRNTPGSWAAGDRLAAARSVPEAP